MKSIIAICAASLGLLVPACANTIRPNSGTSPITIPLGQGNRMQNYVLTGSSNISTSRIGSPAKNTEVKKTSLKPYVTKVQITSKDSYVGAQFVGCQDDKFFGVWEYPFAGSLSNANVTFDLKGVGNEVGINWSNARAPFFMTSSGYGIYADTLAMGTYNFSVPGQAQFVFNTSALTYYIILPSSNDFPMKSIIQEYTSLSARIEMPPDSSFGPNFWSDDFEQDFHGSVSNAQENYFDVINHLYANKIRATSMFADRKMSSLSSEYWTDAGQGHTELVTARLGTLTLILSTTLRRDSSSQTSPIMALTSRFGLPTELSSTQSFSTSPLPTIGCSKASTLCNSLVRL